MQIPYFLERFNGYAGYGIAVRRSLVARRHSGTRHRCIQLKPIDVAALREAADATGAIVTVEDHYPAGGLGDAVLQALADRPVPATILAVDKAPMSGSGDELRNFEGISAAAIVKTVKRLITSERVSPTRLIANLGDMNRLGWVDRAARRNIRA